MRHTLYHGGYPGLRVGDLLLPSTPHVTDGCPVCVARAKGRIYTVGEYRRWARTLGSRGLPILEALAGEPESAPVDPPSERKAVYVTASREYATWYAARSRGDLYEVVPAAGSIVPSTEDNFPTWTCEAARVVRVVRRGVVLNRQERRQINRLWAKADRRRALAEVAS